MEKNSHRENITDWLNVSRLLLSDNLRGNEARCSTTVEDVGLQITESCQTEIHNDWLRKIILSKEDVFWFHVSMDDSLLVEVLQA